MRQSPKSVHFAVHRSRAIGLFGALCLMTLSVLSPARAAGQDSTSIAHSCQAFVQDYYNWYVSKKNSSIEEAIKARPEAFSPNLLHSLKADIAAQAKDPGELVGLDFDPVLNSQDPSTHYSVGAVRINHGRCFADLYSVNAGKKGAKPDVTPELSRRNGKFQFENFHYGKSDIPVNENLVSILDVLKKDRLEDAKQHSHH